MTALLSKNKYNYDMMNKELIVSIQEYVLHLVHIVYCSWHLCSDQCDEAVITFV